MSEAWLSILTKKLSETWHEVPLGAAQSAAQEMLLAVLSRYLLLHLTPFSELLVTLSDLKGAMDASWSSSSTITMPLAPNLIGPE